MCDIFMCDPLTKTTTDNHILVPMCIYGAINTWSSTDGHITQGKPICMMVLSQSPALSLLYISHHPSWSPPALRQPSPHLLHITTWLLMHHTCTSSTPPPFINLHVPPLWVWSYQRLRVMNRASVAGSETGSAGSLWFRFQLMFKTITFKALN